MTDTPYGDVKYADPGYLDSQGNQAKGGNGVKRYPIDEAHVKAAWSYINMPKNQKGYTSEQLAAVKARIRAAMKEHGHEVAGDDNADDVGHRVAGSIDERAAQLDGVDVSQRIITLMAVPYEQSTQVEYRGQMWREVFSRSAFQGFDPARRRVPVSSVLSAPAYTHEGGHLVGKVTAVYPERDEGLVLDVRISATPNGDDTLQLAADDALSPSVGFMASGRDQTLNRATMTRRINRAYLDHLSLVPVPAYDGARILAMRTASLQPLPPMPGIDQYFADPLTRWIDERLMSCE